MTSDENPADTVVEQAARVALDAMEAKQCADKEAVRAALGDLAVDLDGKEHDYRVEAWEVARALHAAGLLADPADRDEPYDQLDNQRNLWAKQCHEAEARAERAEAELDELRATVDRVTTLRDHWAHMAGLAMDADTREWLDAASKSLRAALDPEGGA